MTLNVDMQHHVLEYYQVCSNGDPGLTLTYFTARSNLVPYAFVWEKGKTMGFSETIVVCDIKVSRPPWDGGTKACSNDPGGTWPRWSPCPYMVKTFKNLIIWNGKADDPETWYAASSTWVLQCLLKWCPCVDLDVFYGKVKFGPLCFCMGKSSNNGFFRNHCSLWIKVVDAVN